MKPDATDSLTNEWIAERLGYEVDRFQVPYGGEGPELQSGYILRKGGRKYNPIDWIGTLDLALRDLIPEIVRRGYQVVILFGDFGAHVQLLDPRRVVEAWECIDSPSIARAICEALVMTEGQP